MGSEMEIRTSSGTVKGGLADGVYAFTGIRYGRLAEGRRFDPVAATLADAKQDIRDLPAVFPQLPSRLSAVTGPAVEAHPQEEDAFLLNVWAPADVSGLPVLVMIHGGAFVSGGGGVRWYRGEVLAREGLMVVVTVNFRLGPLAHLSLGADDSPNRALGDLSEALRWVRQNIETFGGDPDNITLAGQSSGGFLAKLLAVLPSEREKFRRLFIMSSPGIPALSRGETERLSAAVIAGLNGADPRTAPIAALMESHRNMMAANRSFGKVGMGLMPTVDRGVPDWLNDPTKVAAELRVTDLLVTFTRDETTSFFFTGPERQVTSEQLKELYGTPAGAADSPYWELVERTSTARFGNPARELAAAAAARGINTRVREFVLSSPLEDLGCGHCMDLPYLFGNYDDWYDAPMLHGVTRNQFEEESRRLRGLVADLVHGRMKASVVRLS